MTDPDPAYVQRNIESLAKIGGVYDLLAVQVEVDHAVMLRIWRLDNPAKSALELLAENRGETPQLDTNQGAKCPR